MRKMTSEIGTHHDSNNGSRFIIRMWLRERNSSLSEN